MINAISLYSILVYKNKVVGYRCKLIDGKFVDVDADVVVKAKINVPLNLVAQNLLEHGDKLITQYEIDNNLNVQDGSTNGAVIKWLKKTYGR